MKKKHTQTHEEVSLDLSGIKPMFTKAGSFFKKADMETVVMWTFLIFCVALVFSIRMLPSSLPLTDDWADNLIQQSVRSQISQQISQQYPALPEANRNALIEKQLQETISKDQAQYDLLKAELSEQYKTFMRYTGEDGKQYTYLGDLDSYFWARYARNYLEQGVTCDLITDEGECRDMYVLAPWGTISGRNPSLHVFGIAYLHKLITLFNPQHPLTASSFLLQAVLGALTAIPAFFIGRKVAGNVGGLFAAIIISLHPLYLSRSLGSDNDPWILIMSLMMMWMIIEAADAKGWTRRIIFAALTGVFTGLLAASWAGWWFFYVILLFGIISWIGYLIIESLLKQEKPWESARIKAAAAILGIFYLGSYITTATFSEMTLASKTYFKIPLATINASTNLAQAVINDFWPNVLTTVAELNKSSFPEAVSSFGGPFLFLIALMGLVLLILPRENWNWRHYALLGASMLISLYLVTQTPANKWLVLVLIALPIAIAIIISFFGDEPNELLAVFIILIWFLASVYAVYNGVRFILLMIPAFGIAFAVAAGRAHEAITKWLAGEFPWHRYITSAIVFVIIALLLISPVRGGYSTARNYIPSIDDAWWDTLTKIREESAPDAILNSWWDFGHWFKYVADRRVSADGTTQHTHVPRWLGLALVTPDEDQSIGILRMLDCGSDAYPSAEGKLGAYGYLYEKTGDSIRSERIIREVVTFNTKEEARKYLADAGFTEEDQRIILERTHCDPPEDYFITSGDMVGKAGVWAHFGLWDFQKAYIAAEARNKPQSQAVPELVERFGYTQEEAENLYYTAKSLTTEGDINAFAAPWPGYITGSWVGCTEQLNGSIVTCPLGIVVGQSGNTQTAIDAFVFNASDPRASRVMYGAYQNGARVGVIENGTPQLLSVAYAQEREDFRYVNPTSPGIGVLYDAVNKRVLLADPLLVPSTFTHLFYLDGRYSEHYVKFDDRTGFTGSRVITWKVDWNGKST